MPRFIFNKEPPSSNGLLGQMVPPMHRGIPESLETKNTVDPLESWYSGNEGPWIPRNTVADAVHETGSQTKYSFIWPDSASHAVLPTSNWINSGPWIDQRVFDEAQDEFHMTRPVIELESAHGTHMRNLAKTTDSSGTLNAQHQYHIPLSDSGYGSMRSYENASVRSYETAGDFNRMHWNIPIAPGGLTCPTCSKAVKTRSELKKHELRHTKPFMCRVNQCPRTQGYSTSNDLERHMMSKHAIVPQNLQQYRCTVEKCKSKDKIWPRLDNFRSHLKRIHKLQDEEAESHVGRSRHNSFALVLDEAPSDKTAITTLQGSVSAENLVQDKWVAFYDAESEQAREPPTKAQDDNKQLVFETIDRETTLKRPRYPALDADLREAITAVFNSQSGKRTDLPINKSSPGSSFSKSTAEIPVAASVMSEHTYGPNLTHMSTTSDTSSHYPHAQEDNRTLLTDEVLEAVRKAGFTLKRDHKLTGAAGTDQTGLTARKSENLVQCTECTGFKGRPCELNKHMKRHERPYGCTFPRCKKAFSSKNDWKRHENSEHYQSELWRCEECMSAFYQVGLFLTHLARQHNIEDNDVIKQKIKEQRIGPNFQAHFWCGFCTKIINLNEKGIDAWTERFNHIDDHFMGRNGIEKRSILSWVHASGEDSNETPPGYKYEQQREAFGDNSYFSESNSSSSEPVSLKGKIVARSRSRPYDLPDDTPAPPPKRIKTAIHITSCCKCSIPYAKDVYIQCFNCNHAPCEKCEDNCEMIADERSNDLSGVGVKRERATDLKDTKYGQINNCFVDRQLFHPTADDTKLELVTVQVANKSNSTSFVSVDHLNGCLKRPNAFKNECEGSEEGEHLDEDVRNGTSHLKQETISEPQQLDVDNSVPVISQDTQQATEHDLTLGKASPYLPQSEDGERESGYDSETELDEDGSETSDLPCESRQAPDLDESKQILFVEGSIAFWNVYNAEFPVIVARCVELATSYANNESSSKPSVESQSKTETDTSSTGPGGFKLPAKRKRSEDEPPPDDDRTQEPEHPDEDGNLLAKRRRYNFACPFRKYNPGKYTIHQPAWKLCATNSFENLARTKEHLYRRHKIWQCLRCWLFFPKEEHLHEHLTVVDNICEVRTGKKPAVDGITPTVETQLRSRKSYKRTEEDRWRDIYALLFPDEDIPTPYFEPVLDDQAQFHVPRNTEIEEFMRQQVHQFWRRRWSEEVRNMRLGYLQECIDTTVRGIIDQAVGDTASLWRQQYSGDTSFSEQYATPVSLSPTRTRLHRASHVSTRSASNFHTENRQSAGPSSKNPDYVSDQVSESTTHGDEDYSRVETAQETYTSHTDIATAMQNSLNPLQSVTYVSNTEPMTAMQDSLDPLLQSVTYVTNTSVHAGTTANSSEAVFQSLDFAISNENLFQQRHNALASESSARVQQQHSISEIEQMRDEDFGFDWYNDQDEMDFSGTWHDKGK